MAKRVPTGRPTKRDPDDAVVRVSDPLYNLSLEKGLSVLRAFDPTHRSMTLVELAERTRMTKASAQRTVHTLQVLGYLGKNERTRRFQLSPKAVEIGANYLMGHPLVQVAHPYLAQLAQSSGETATVAEAVGDEMLYLAQVITSRHLPVFTPPGMRIPMYCTGSGRAYLSMLPDAEVRRLLGATRRIARTPHTVTNLGEILRRVQRCRETGYATNSEELFLGDMGLAAPLRDRHGHPIGALHLTPPTSRWTIDEAEQKLAPLLLECARAISSTFAF